MGVKVQRPGDPGHPGGNRRIYVRVNHGGHRKTRVFNSTKAAQDYASKVEAFLKLGEVEKVFTPPAQPPEVRAPVTFAQAADRWLAVDGPGLKAGTLDTYGDALRKHLLPAFGPSQVGALTVADVETWWADLRRRGYSHAHLTTIRAVLAGILRRAVVSGLILRNPVDAIAGGLGREDREVRQVEWLTEPELRRLLTEAERRELRAYPILLTLASAGLRIGEALGLQVGDVNLARGKLYVRRAVRKGRVGSPKSGKPRTVDLPLATVTVLQAWVDVVRAEAAVLGREPLWLFPSATGLPQDDGVVRQALLRALKAAGIRRRVRVHDLRHTYASLALQRGVPLLTVSRQLGHASIQITGDVYGHLAPEAGREAAAAWEAILTVPGRNPRATAATEPA